MIRSRLAMLVPWTCALAALVMIPIGCDDGPDTNGLDSYFEQHPYISDPRTATFQVVVIDPTSAALSFVGAEAVFSAAGGEAPYSWGVAIGALGHVTPSGDSRSATYRCDVVGTNNVIVADRNGNAAIATVTVTPGAGLATLTAQANPSTLTTDGALSTLTASGGTPPYTWSVLTPGTGQLVGNNTGPSVVYQRFSQVQGDAAISVADNAGAVVNLIITQP
jgi:hypothetical protein